MGPSPHRRSRYFAQNLLDSPPPFHSQCPDLDPLELFMIFLQDVLNTAESTSLPWSKIVIVCPAPEIQTTRSLHGIQDLLQESPNLRLGPLRHYVLPLFLGSHTSLILPACPYVPCGMPSPLLGQWKTGTCLKAHQFARLLLRGTSLPRIPQSNQA